MKSTNKDLDQALQFDCLAEAERITGKSYKENDAVTWLGMSLMQKHNQTKDALLYLNNDTANSKRLIGNIQAIEGMGFKLLASDSIPATSDRWYIYWKDGVLLFFESYSWDGGGDASLNGGHAYFNFRPSSKDGQQAMSGCSYSSDGKVFFGSYDLREGLRHKLDTLRANGELLAKWVQRPWLWLLHYNDTKVKGYDHAAINAERISRLPLEVKAAITPCPPQP